MFSFILVVVQIVHLLDILPPAEDAVFRDLYLVMEKCDADLERVIYSPAGLQEDQMQYIMCVFAIVNLLYMMLFSLQVSNFQGVQVYSFCWGGSSRCQAQQYHDQQGRDDQNW